MKVFLEISLDQKILILVAIRSDVGDYRKINEFTKDDKLNEFKNRVYALTGSYVNNSRYVLYSKLLNSMLANGADGNYSAVAVGHR